MPTYVYKCDSCGAQFEQFQSFKDAPLTVCPSCAGGVRRVFQPVGIVFKGSGWYITDSRKSSTATIGEENAKSEKAPASAAESKPAESKPAESKPAESKASESKSASPSTSSAE